MPRQLFETNTHAGVSILRTPYDPNRDGSRFLVSVRTAHAQTVPITVLLNWKTTPAAP